MSIETIIENGLKYAQEDYLKIALGKFNDVKPKEDQVKCALYRSFSEANYLVHVEASYARNAGRCDLVAIAKKKDYIAIEIKTAWAGTGWVNKPKEQASSWKKDIEKLKSMKKSGFAKHGYFVLSFAYEQSTKYHQQLHTEIQALNGIELPFFQIEDWNGLNAIQFCIVKVFSE